ncbi:MAG: hydroxyisourate hydrolase [Lysobacterales bacterium]
MGRLTTHVLDIANGCPGAAIRIELFRRGQDTAIARTITNTDGRCEHPLLEDDGFVAGEYELVFHAGEYFNAKGQEDGEHRFLDQVVVRFGINDETQHYHVPLLLSPFGYSTYRGS